MAINGNDDIVGGYSAGALGAAQSDVASWCDEDVGGRHTQIVTDDAERQARIECVAVANHHRKAAKHAIAIGSETDIAQSTGGYGEVVEGIHRVVPTYRARGSPCTVRAQAVRSASR